MNVQSKQVSVQYCPTEEMVADFAQTLYTTLYFKLHNYIQGSEPKCQFMCSVFRRENDLEAADSEPMPTGPKAQNENDQLVKND